MHLSSRRAHKSGELSGEYVAAGKQAGEGLGLAAHAVLAVRRGIGVRIGQDYSEAGRSVDAVRALTVAGPPEHLASVRVRGIRVVPLVVVLAGNETEILEAVVRQRSGGIGCE